ncbi:hypothetical protein D3C87_1281990 [compost metagenome]
MHTVVKFTKNNDGDKVERPKWHLSITYSGVAMSLCSGECYGFGVSSCEFQEKDVEIGGINCNDCLGRIKELQSIKLYAKKFKEAKK